jgi:AcrR family transcriptional regulator
LIGDRITGKMKLGLKRKRRDGLQRQSQVMAIALRLFSKKGYHATSIDDIIKEAGIVKGTFYLHFESKYDLLEKIVDSYLQILLEALKLLDISMPKPLPEVKEFYYQISSRLMENDDLKHFIKIFLRDAMSLDEKSLSKLNAFFNEMVNIISQYIKRAQEEGRVVKDIDPLITSYSIIGSVKEVLFHLAVLEENLDIKTTLNTLMDVYFKGMIAEQK